MRRLARANYPMRGNRTVSDSRSAAMASARLRGTSASAFKVVHADVPLGQDQNELPRVSTGPVYRYVRDALKYRAAIDRAPDSFA